MKKLAILVIVLVAFASAQDRSYTKATAKNYAVTSGWTWKNLGSIGEKYMQIFFSGLGADSIHVAFHATTADTSIGNRLSYGVRDSATWITLPVMYIDSIGVRTKTTTANVFFQYRQFK